MISVSICDDDVNELDKTNRMCHTYKEKHQKTDIRIRCFSSPLEMQHAVAEEEKFDLYLLDIYMPELMGTDVAKFLRNNHEDCQIIFLTTSVNHAIEAFSLHAAHYLVKPYTQEQLEGALNKAIQAIEKKSKAQIIIKTSDGTHKVSFSDFLYAETDKHIQRIYLKDGKYHQVRIASTELFNSLSSDNRFFKCGSTYIINLDKVEEITRNHILFEVGIKIPMQRRQYKDLIDRYTAYALEGM